MNNTHHPTLSHNLICEIIKLLPPRTLFIFATLLRLPIQHYAITARPKRKFQVRNLQVLPSMDEASARGLTNLLEIYRSAHNAGIPITYTNSIDFASEMRRIEVLDWWKSSGLELVYSRNAIHSVCTIPDDVPLGILKLTHRNLDYGPHSKREVLDWWLRSGLEMKYREEEVYNYASMNGDVEILEWWKKSRGLEMKYTSDPVDLASAFGRLNVLNWWKDSGLEFKWTSNAIDDATTSPLRYAQVIEWWMESGLELRFTDTAVIAAIVNGQIKFLDLVVESGNQVDWDNVFQNTLISLSNNKCVLEGVQWLADSGLLSLSQEKEVRCLLEARESEDANGMMRGR